MAQQVEDNIPLWEKYALTINQAAKYFNIGTKKLRNLITIYEDENWYMLNGDRILIKRRLFEEFLDKVAVL